MKATYLELRDAVSVECLLVDVGGKAKRIEEPGWGNNAKLIFVSHLDGRSAGGTLSGSEGSSRAEKGGDEGELHGVGSESLPCVCSSGLGMLAAAGPGYCGELPSEVRASRLQICT